MPLCTMTPPLGGFLAKASLVAPDTSDRCLTSIIWLGFFCSGQSHMLISLTFFGSNVKRWTFLKASWVVAQGRGHISVYRPPSRKQAKGTVECKVQSYAAQSLLARCGCHWSRRCSALCLHNWSIGMRGTGGLSTYAINLLRGAL